MRRYNRIKAVFGAAKSIKAPPINYEYDTVQKLVITGLDLPLYYEVDFCNVGDADTITVVSDEEGAVIPDDCFLSGKDIKAYIVVGGDDGSVQTRYEITIPVKKRPRRTDIQPTPAEQTQINSLVAAMNDAVERSASSASDAEGSAIDARDSAEQAEDSAEQAKGYADSAEDSAREASEYEERSRRSAEEAERSAESSAESESNAAESESRAEQSAVDANQSAERAEQAAASSGYLFFHIDENGDLILERTRNTQVDFSLVDGDLILQEAV